MTCATNSYLADLIEGTLKGRGEDMPWAVGGLTVAEWRQVVAAIRGLAGPSGGMIDSDWIYREFIRRGFQQSYAYDFINQARETELSRQLATSGGK